MDSSDELVSISALPFTAVRAEQRLVTAKMRTLLLATSQLIRWTRVARKEERWVAVGEVVEREERREEEERKWEWEAECWGRRKSTA